MTLLEDRLAAAGDQLDDLIETQLTRPDRHANATRPHRLLVLAACLVVVAGLAGLLWSGSRSDPVASPLVDEVAVREPSPATTLEHVTSPPAPALAPSSTSFTSSNPSDATTPVPVELRPPVAIGESVMLGAAPQLQAGGFLVVASESRLGEVQADVVGQLRAAGQLGEVVVLQVGTNGPVAEETYDRIMSSLPADEVPTVLFLTVHAPGRGWIEPNNALIRELPSRYPNVRVLDWAGLVESGQVPGLAGDGIHLGTDAAKQFYANYVFDVIGRRDLVQPLPVD